LTDNDNDKVRNSHEMVAKQKQQQIMVSRNRKDSTVDYATTNAAQTLGKMVQTAVKEQNNFNHFRNYTKNVKKQQILMKKMMNITTLTMKKTVMMIARKKLLKTITMMFPTADFQMEVITTTTTLDNLMKAKMNTQTPKSRMERKLMKRNCNDMAEDTL